MAVLPTAGFAQSVTQSLQRSIITFKNQLGAGISYAEYPRAIAEVNTEIEVAERSGAVSSGATGALAVLQADMTMMNMAWSLRFGPLAGARSPFTFCKSDVGNVFASTGAAFKEQGLLDADLKTQDLSGQCAYYTDETIGQLLSAVARQADKSLDALAARKAPVRKRR